MKKHVVLFVTIIGCSIALMWNGCKPPDGQKLTAVSLATGKNVWCALVLVAKEKGFFKEEGLDVSLNYQDAGRYCMDALLSRSVDLAAVVEANVAYVGFTGNQSPVVVAELAASSCGIVARRDKGIQGPTDLRGKRIGYTPATGAEPFLYRFLARHDIAFQDADLRKMQPKALQPALVAGEIDAAATWEPFIYNCIKAMPGNGIEFRDPEAFTGYMMLATSREILTERKPVLNAVLRGLRKAETFIAQNPTEAKNFLAATLGMEGKDVEGVWPYFDLKLRMDKSVLLRAIQFVGENARKTDPVFADKQLPDYNIYIDDSVLRSALP